MSRTDAQNGVDIIFKLEMSPVMTAMTLILICVCMFVCGRGGRRVVFGT
jgi:hypothetical protein